MPNPPRVFRAVSPFLAVCLWASASPCRAGPESLSAMLERARASEPTYMGAKMTVEVARARTDQAFGALMPQVSGTANMNANERNYATRNSGTPALKDRYDSLTAQLSITQPLLRYANFEGVRQAREAALQAEHQLVGAEQELLAKLVAAWFDVIASRDDVAFTLQQVAATRRQWEVARRGSELGTTGLPQVEETKAKYEQAVSDSVAAQTDGELKWAVLEQIVGALEDFTPPAMREDAILADLSGDTLDQWLREAEARNPGILAANQALEAAASEVRKQYGGHLPTVDLVASYGQNSQSVGNFPGQNGYDIVTGTVGLQLNVPIFSGGTQAAKVAEAVALKEKARLDVEAARRAARLATKQAWVGWRAAHARTQAALQSVRAADAALLAARRGVETGLKTELDVLQAEQQLASARRDLGRGRYDQVVAHVKMKAALGDLSVADVDSLDSLLVAPGGAKPGYPAPSADDAALIHVQLAQP